jgi:hypothetical protein
VPTRCGRRRLAAPGHRCHHPCAARQHLPPWGAQLERQASLQPRDFETGILKKKCVASESVVGGNVVLDHGSLPEGAEVGVFVTREQGSVRLPPSMQKELEAALDGADREEGISADELFAELRKYG